MRNVSTPPRRKSIINMFSTPPLRRSMLSGKAANSPFRHPSPQRISNATGSDDDEENTLTATGDISISHPYYVPGVSGALSPQPRSRRGTPHMKAGLPARGPMRPRPPMRRLSSDTYKFRTFTKKAGPLSSAVTPSRAPTNASAAPQVIRTPAVVESTPTCSGNTSVSSWDSSIGSIADEDVQLSTPQSRFEAFMRSRDLAKSPKKKADTSMADRNREVDILAQEAASALGREVARRASRPLRGNARLPPRLPIPTWDRMDVDN